MEVQVKPDEVLDPIDLEEEELLALAVEMYLQQATTGLSEEVGDFPL